MRSTTHLAMGAGVLVAALLSGSPSRAEFQVSVYGGLNGNLDSTVTLDKGALHDEREVGWDGKSFNMPPYWGARATYWLDSHPSWGLAIDYTHAKAYADIDFATDVVYDHLEFTDGNNLLTGNLLYRWNDGGRGWVPYVGGGIGLSIPHVEIFLDAFPGDNTWEYQTAGIALQALAGVEYRFDPRWSMFAEGRLSYSHIDAEVSGGGSLETDLWSPHFSVGLSYRLGGSE